MDLATLLVQCRLRAGLTQRELARRAETSAAAVCLYERGERVPRVDTLMRLVAATGHTLELTVAPPSHRVNVKANGLILEELLDLADRLPQRDAGDLAQPPFAELVKAVS